MAGGGRSNFREWERSHPKGKALFQNKAWTGWRDLSLTTGMADSSSTASRSASSLSYPMPPSGPSSTASISSSATTRNIGIRAATRRRSAPSSDGTWASSISSSIRFSTIPGTGLKNLDFASSARIAYNIDKTWAIAAETYSDYGVVRQFLPLSQQSQQIFGVVDYRTDDFNIEAGVGFGLTPASDRLVVKLMVSRDLYTPLKTNAARGPLQNAKLP